MERQCQADEDALHAIVAKKAESQKIRSTTTAEVNRLRKAEQDLKPKIEKLKDKIQDEETTNLASFVSVTS